jgi:hypothetical protein
MPSLSSAFRSGFFSGSGIGMMAAIVGVYAFGDGFLFLLGGAAVAASLTGAAIARRDRGLMKRAIFIAPALLLSVPALAAEQPNPCSHGPQTATLGGQDLTVLKCQLAVEAPASDTEGGNRAGRATAGTVTVSNGIVTHY